MKVDIQSIHFTADYKLLDFVTKKMEKVQTFYDGIKSTDVYLKVEKEEISKKPLVGYNYRLSDINCALGLSQLKKINKFINAYDDTNNPQLKFLPFHKPNVAYK